MKKLFKRIFCKHRSGYFVRNIYGDEINLTGERSIWKCLGCGKYLYSGQLNEKEEAK
jgi:hypothetical protein